MGSRGILFVAVMIAGGLGQACGGGSSGGSTPLSAPSLPLAPTPTGCTGSLVGGVEININAPSTLSVFGETFNIQNASGQSTFKIQRNAVPCDYELIGQLGPGNFNAILGFTRTTDPRNDTGGIEASSLVVDQGGTGTPASQNPCLLNVNTTTGSFRLRFKVVASNGCRGGTP